MSEYRLFKVIRTDGQKYFDIEYVRDVVMCRECIHCADDWNGNQPMFTCELGRCGESVQPNDFCSYGCRKERSE